MKNKLSILAVLLSLLLLCSCNSQKKAANTDTDTEPAPPENGVYYEYSDVGDSDRVLSSTTYDNGVAVSRNEYDYWTDGSLKSIITSKDGTVTDTWSYNYSEEGILSQMVRQYDDGGFECRDDYRYDANGNMTSLSVYESDSFIGGEKYSYTEKGTLIREDVLDSNGDVISYTEYTTDENENYQRVESFMYGSLFSYGTYAYNDKGQLHEICYYTSADALTHSVRNEYDENGNLTRSSSIDADGTVTGCTECLYDEDGFNYRDIFYEDGKPVYRYDYTKDGARIYSAYN